MNRAISQPSPVPQVDPKWLALRRDFDRARRGCSSAFAGLIQAIEGSAPLDVALDAWRGACSQRARVDDNIAAYVGTLAHAAQTDAQERKSSNH